MNDLFDDARAHARHSDPSTSHEAAASVKLTENQQAILTVFKTHLDQHLTDEELIIGYHMRQRGLGLPPQSDSGIRSRRAELSNAGKLTQGPDGKTKGGRRCRSWRAA